MASVRIALVTSGDAHANSVIRQRRLGAGVVAISVKFFFEESTAQVLAVLLVLCDFASASAWGGASFDS
jgi:hypothetical protein